VLADEIGRTDGVGARRQRREHHQAVRTSRRDVHATGTALLKTGDKRRTEAEKHDNAPRIAGTGSHPKRPSSPRSDFLRAICDPPDSRVIRCVCRCARLSLCEGDFVLKCSTTHDSGRKGIGRVATATRTDRTERVDRWPAIASSCCGRPWRKARGTSLIEKRRCAPMAADFGLAESAPPLDCREIEIADANRAFQLVYKRPREENHRSVRFNPVPPSRRELTAIPGTR
jgi:hypothetical protein